MIARAVALGAVHALALLSAAHSYGLELSRALLTESVGHMGKGVGRCLHSGMALMMGNEVAEQTTFVSYVPAAVAGICNTYAAVFYNRSSWIWLAFLDVCALWVVARQHRQEHAEAAATTSVRRAVADPANTATSCCLQPSSEDLRLLRGAAVHSKAAYGVPAASGHVSSAAGFLTVVTLHQATGKAPRRIPAAMHLAAVQQLTGCPPSDVLTAQWQAHHHRPAFYVAIDRQRRCVVVSVRGTLQLGDFCTVLDAKPMSTVLAGVRGHVHTGFLAAARNLLPQVAAALSTASTSCPGWPVLLTGHSLGGGVAAVLAVLLLESGSQLKQHDWRQLGELQCVGIGGAAAFCRVLGWWCRPHVTSVLYGADCLPMFSALGARMLIEQVHASSWAAAAVGCLLRRTGLALGTSSGASSPDRTASGASSTNSSQACGAACSAAGCRDLCAAATDSVSELQEIEALAEAPRSGDSRLQRCGSAWSSASSTSIAAFACDSGSETELEAEHEGRGLVPMYPPGRILWMLPSKAGSASSGSAELGLYEMDQTSFQRFLITLETAVHHLPDSYITALDRLATLPAT